MKIKIKTVQEMKGGKNRKTLAKILVRGIFRIRDIGRMLYPNYGDAMLVLIRMGANMADGNQQKHLLTSFVTKA